MKRWFNWFAKSDYQNMGIDLGTANTLVVVHDRGIVVQEPSVVAVESSSKEVLAIGHDAYLMVGRTPGNLIAIRPLKDGVIADFTMTEHMIRSFIKKAMRVSGLSSPRILVGIPWGITELEKRAVFDASANAGATETYLIDEPMAAAVGAGLSVDSPKGHMIVDIGGGTTEVAVISMGGLVTCKSIRIAGIEMDDTIVSHCRKNYNLLIGERMAESIKIDIGSAYPFDEERSTTVRGRDLLSGLPRTFTLSSYEIRDALSEPVHAIIESIKLTLEKTPPELAADIMDTGIVMMGGGALLHGLCEYVAQETGVRVSRAPDPLLCVAVGTQRILGDPDLMATIHSSIFRRR